MNDKEPVEFVGTEDSNIDFIDDVYMLLNKHVTPGTCSFILRVGERAYPRMTFSSCCAISGILTTREHKKYSIQF